jgi:hypothetical protein
MSTVNNAQGRETVSVHCVVCAKHDKVVTDQLAAGCQTVVARYTPRDTPRG